MALPAWRRERDLLGFALLGALCWMQAFFVFPRHAAVSDAPPRQTDQRDWSAGGNLQQASFEQWRAATPANQLASAADLLKQLRREQVFRASIRSESDYRPWALALVRCLAQHSEKGQQPVVVSARQCTANEGLKAYLLPSSGR
ncbi:MAG: hypothetical protein ACO1RX_16855 [Candidatus Sericytochromatia bacterium]